jgi:8-oxo-dGTP pyrophosphatase MutT (NUDIX family)
MVITPPESNFDNKNAHCGWCGSKFAEQITYPRKCFRCGKGTYSNPIPVAVAMIPMWRDASLSLPTGLLIGKRNIQPKKDQWALPGGFMEMNETWQEACAREVKEEIGLVTDPENYELNAVMLAGNGNLLIFGLYKGFKLWSDINFITNEETTEVDLACVPTELAFPTHTMVLNRWVCER